MAFRPWGFLSSISVLKRSISGLKPPTTDCSMAFRPWVPLKVFPIQFRGCSMAFRPWDFLSSISVLKRSISGLKPPTTGVAWPLGHGFISGVSQSNIEVVAWSSGHGFISGFNPSISGLKPPTTGLVCLLFFVDFNSAADGRHLNLTVSAVMGKFKPATRPIFGFMFFILGNFVNNPTTGMTL